MTAMSAKSPPRFPALRFTATECGSKVENGTMICGASNSLATDGPQHSFILMRRHRSLVDDDGPYFELDEQTNGFHDGVARVCFDGSVVTFHLQPPAGLGSGHATIAVDLRDCRPADVKRFRRGLDNVFRDQAWRLESADDTNEVMR